MIQPQFNDLKRPETIINHIEQLIDEVKINDLGTVLQSLEVDPTEELKLPKTAWEQQNENNTAILGTLGNFSLIIGKAKSRKSFLCMSVFNHTPVMLAITSLSNSLSSKYLRFNL